MDTAVTTDFAATATELRADGYEERAPSPIAAEIDGGVVLQQPCDCGATRVYRPFSRRESYRAFAVCGRCGAVEEF